MWYAIIDKKTSELFSIGTVLANPMPKEFFVIPIGEKSTWENSDWDKTTLSFISTKIRKSVNVIDILSDPTLNLTTSQITKLETNLGIKL